MDTETIETVSRPDAAAPVSEAEGAARLRAHLTAGALLAVSGGADSMALLALAIQCHRRFATPPPQIFSFDHGLRPESGAECEMVAGVCRAWGLRHHTRRWSRRELSAGGVQAAAREARYGSGLALAEAEGLTRLLTAHQMDDQAETVWMRLERGGGARRLAGIHPRIGRPGEGPVIVRPLLDLPRARLRATAVQHAMPFIDDPSNDDARFERVRARASLAANSSRIVDLASLASDMARRSAVLEQQVSRRLKADATVRDGRIEGSVHLLRGPVRLRRAVLRRILMAAGGTARPPDSRALDGLAQALAGDGPGRSRTLAGVWMARTGDRLEAMREWGRHGPPDLALHCSSDDRLWDGRFRVKALSNLADGGGRALVRAFGHCGRGNNFERTLPSLWSEGRCVAVPPLLASKAPPGASADLNLECVVEKRLLDPYLGGLRDRLRIEMSQTVSETH